MPKKQILTILIFAACYLIISIPFVYSYAVGSSLETGKRARMSIFEPNLRIIDDLKPVDCESSDYISFHMFMENLPSGSNITVIEAYVTDLYYTDRRYNVSSSLLCTPTRNLISNEEISCHLDVEELISKIPSCPMERMDNRLDLFLDVQTETGRFRLSDSKRIVITKPGIQPNLRIDFQVTYPPQPKPRINCLTGSIVDVPLVLEHTEVFHGETEWSLRINNSQELRELIDCELTLEGDYREEGKNDIYMCILTVPSTFFSSCRGGSIPLEILARNRDYVVSDSFETTIFSQTLNLGLSIDDIETIECQIINQEGLCIPVNPQQNVSVTITGNVPKYIEAFDFTYKLGDENETATYCRRERYNNYECMVFITKDTLPFPSGSGTTTKSRDLNLSMQIKHINYYQTLTESAEVEMEGKAIHDFLGAKKALEEKKEQLKKWQKWRGDLESAAYWIDFISLCCKLVVLEKQLNDIKWLNQMSQTYGRTLPGLLGDTFRGIAENTGQFLKVVEKVGNEVFIILRIVQDEMLSILMSAGPGVIGCIGEAAMKAVDIEIENIEDFERGAINRELSVPGNILDYLKSLVTCVGESFWNNISSRWKGYLCMVATFLLSKTPAAGVVTFLCKVITTLSGPLKIMVTLALLLMNAVIMDIAINIATEAVAVAREEINIQLRAQNILADYMEYMKNTLLAIAMARVNSEVHGILRPDIAADQVSLYFISDRTGTLDYDGEICRGDTLTIKYNFEKLNLTENFISRLVMQNFERPFTTALLLPGLEGEYGPYSIDSILRTNPNNNPSSLYAFTLGYTVEGVTQQVGYRIYYNNETCI